MTLVIKSTMTRLFTNRIPATLQCPSRNESEMKSHLRVYHAGDNAKNKAVMCPHCKKSFTERNIERHWAVCYERAQGRMGSSVELIGFHQI